jgi:hypothetical protein
MEYNLAKKGQHGQCKIYLHRDLYSSRDIASDVRLARVIYCRAGPKFLVIKQQTSLSNQRNLDSAFKSFVARYDCKDSMSRCS